MDKTMLIKNLQCPEGKIDIVLDTDTYNEIDDQFAVAYMLSYGEKLNVKALYAAPFYNKRSDSPEDGMEKSYQEILHLLELMERNDLKSIVFKGSTQYLENETTPVKSPAAENLCELAMNYSAEKPLYVVAIGAITNVASAILMKPEIIDRIVVVWLGGNALHWPHTREFNMCQDVAGARVVFGSGVPLIQLPCMGVVSAFTISEAELNYWLKGKNALCDYLVQHTIDEVTYAVGKPWTRAIWDVTAVAWLIGGFTSSILIPSPIPEYDHHYGSDPTRHMINYVYHIDRDKLVQDLFKQLAGNPHFQP